MSKITCPYCNGKGGHVSSGDGWEEWDECGCCDPNCDSATPGQTTKSRVAQYAKQQAAEEARWEKMLAEAEARGELE